MSIWRVDGEIVAGTQAESTPMFIRYAVIQLRESSGKIRKINDALVLKNVAPHLQSGSKVTLHIYDATKRVCIFALTTKNGTFDDIDELSEYKQKSRKAISFYVMLLVCFLAAMIAIGGVGHPILGGLAAIAMTIIIMCNIAAWSLEGGDIPDRAALVAAVYEQATATEEARIALEELDPATREAVEIQKWFSASYGHRISLAQAQELIQARAEGRLLMVCDRLKALVKSTEGAA